MPVVRFKVVPSHNGLLLPAVGATGIGFTVTARVAGGLVPQLLLAVTVIFPEVDPNVTETDVPVPEMVAPTGAVQV